MTVPALNLALVKAAILLDGNGAPVNVPAEADDGRGVTLAGDLFGLILVDKAGAPVDIETLLGGAQAQPDAIVANLAARAEFDTAARFFSVLVSDDEEIYYKLSADPGDWSGPVPWSETIAGYTHTQGAAASTWTINHNLGRKPLVTLLSTGGVEFEGQITHVSLNQVVANLAGAFAGTARCL